MLLVAWAGAPIGATYALMFDGGFGSRFAWSETLTRATPLILTGLSAAVAFRARLWNIGAEGQLYAGALAAVAVGGLHGGTGFDAAAGCAVSRDARRRDARRRAAAARARRCCETRLGVDEVVTTLLLNFIVLLFVSMMLDGPMKDPTAHGLAAKRRAAGRPAARQADRAHARAHRARLSRSALRRRCWALVNARTTFGFEVRAVGANARAAAFAGVPVDAHDGRSSRCCRARSPGSPARSRSPGAPAT